MTYMTADSRPWRPIPAGSSASPYAIGEPGDDLALVLRGGTRQRRAGRRGLAVGDRTAQSYGSPRVSLRPVVRLDAAGTNVVLRCPGKASPTRPTGCRSTRWPSNAAMIGGASRAGFVHEGTLRGACWVNGEFADEVILGLLADDWASGGTEPDTMSVAAPGAPRRHGSTTSPPCSGRRIPIPRCAGASATGWTGRPTVRWRGLPGVSTCRSCAAARSRLASWPTPKPRSPGGRPWRPRLELPFARSARIRRPRSQPRWPGRCW